MLTSLAGCDGCRPGPTAAPTNSDAALGDFTALPPRPLPSDRNPSQNYVKPGHWFTASQSLRSNKIDARGELQTELKVAADSDATNPSRDSRVTRSLVSSRPAVLPKSQMRRFDIRVQTPSLGGTIGNRMRLSSRFTAATLSIDTPQQPCSVLAAEEYFVVVLARASERFARLQTGDWVRPFHDPLAATRPSQHYRMLFPSDEGLLAIPATMLDYTHTAVLIWDDIPADSLTPGQLQAIRDWIHFGGRLIVNGPDAADALSSSSLASLLPIESGGNIELDLDAVSGMLAAWAVSDDDSTPRQIERVRGSATRVAVGGDLRGDAFAVVGTHELVATRRVGRGLICQTRFDFASGWLANWKSLDSFLNAAILARPSREFVNSETRVNDLGGSNSEASFPLVIQRFANRQIRDADLPAINTSLRLLARDAVLALPGIGDTGQTPGPPDTSPPSDEFADPTGSIDGAAAGNEPTVARSLTRIDPVSGVGGWTDSSDVMAIVAQVLRSESGIEIPKSSLVIRSLGIYLLLLVPVNYVVFRLLGRLEYAWLAAPVIAILGAIWVAREAQLDIGFARSQTELAVLELPANYTRGHLTRGVAIYNSLSTQYDVLFDHSDAVAALLSSADDDIANRGVVFETASGDGPMLLGVNVGSNQVRMLHSEEIVDVGGVIRRQGDSLINETAYDLADVLVVERTTQSDATVAIVSSCAAGGRVPLRFRGSGDVMVSSELPMQTQRLIERLIATESLTIGSSRIVARIEQSIPGMTIVPAASQRNFQTVLVAHLNYGLGDSSPSPSQVSTATSARMPTPDVNLVGSLLKDRPSDLEATDGLMRDEP